MNTEKLAILNARKIYYLLLSRLFIFNERDDRFFGILEILNTLKDFAFDEKNEIAINNLTQIFKSPKDVCDEYDDIFHAPPKPLHNTFSYYDEGYSSGSACIKVKNIIAKTDIRRNEREFKENEDNIGFVFHLMFEFINRHIQNKSEYEDYAKEMFENIINPFIDEFIKILYSHENAKIYKDVCIILQSFIEFERVYYSLAKPVYEKNRNLKSQNCISRSEKLRRETNKARRESEKLNQKRE